MAFTPKPCTQCGGTNFYALPSVGLEYGTATTLLGMQAFKHVKGKYMWVSLVVCQQCGRTETFMSNAAELAQLVPNASVMSAK